MKPETTTLLYTISDALKTMRQELDAHMYHGEALPQEDQRLCRKVYDSICKTMDLL
jgi:hypothetical protein